MITHTHLSFMLLIIRAWVELSITKCSMNHLYRGVVNWGSSKRVDRNSYLSYSAFLAFSPAASWWRYPHIIIWGCSNMYQTLGVQVPRVPLKSMWQFWAIPHFLGCPTSTNQQFIYWGRTSTTRRLGLLHLHCLPWRSQVVLHLPLHPKWGIPTWWARWVISRSTIDIEKETKIGISFEKRIFYLYSWRLY